MNDSNLNADSSDSADDKELADFESKLQSLLTDNAFEKSQESSLEESVMSAIGGQSPRELEWSSEQSWILKVCAAAALVFFSLSLIRVIDSNQLETEQATESAKYVDSPSDLLYEERYTSYQQSPMALSNLYFGDFDH